MGNCVDSDSSNNDRKDVDNLLSRDRNHSFHALKKVILLGDSGAGKTSCCLRFTDKYFEPNFISTIGVDFKTKDYEYEDKIIRMQIWDTAGQERYKTIMTQYYRGVNGAIFVFDITNRMTFDNVSKWMSSIESNKTGEETISKILIGNKIDQETNRAVSLSEAKSFAFDQGCEYIEYLIKCLN
eukprot:gene6400-10407_t